MLACVSYPSYKLPDALTDPRLGTPATEEKGTHTNGSELRQALSPTQLLRLGILAWDGPSQNY